MKKKKSVPVKTKKPTHLMKKNDADLSEKRKFTRLESSHILTHIKYHLTLNEKDIFEGRIKNYSARGALFESTVKYNIGDMLKLEISIAEWKKYRNDFYKAEQLSKSAPVVVLASVVRIEAIAVELFDIGVNFIAVDRWDQEALDKQIDIILKINKVR